jgi:hypothetical protein
MGRTIAGSVRNPGANGRIGSLVYAPIAAAGLLSLALLDLAVRVALFPRLRSERTASILWGIGFALFLWFGLWTLKIPEPNAILFAVIAGVAIALFVYLRGAALEAPPLERPGSPLRRRRDVRRPARRARTADELHQVRVALVDDDLDAALFLLRDAEHVAVAQRKLGRLLQVRALLRTVSERSRGRTARGCRELERRIAEDLASFPVADLEAAGVALEPVPGLAEEPTTELGRARVALDDDDAPTALFFLRQARSVALAQGRPPELRQVGALATALADLSGGRTRAAALRLARQVEADLR